MVSKTLFPTRKGKSPKPVSTNADGSTYKNAAGGVAFKHGPKLALAQLVSTGTLSDTFYTGAESQLKQVKELAGSIEPTFVAKCAIYARQKGYMKDMPALLLALLSTRVKETGPAATEARESLEKAFHRVVDNPKMLRNFVQIIRSATVGRRSMGSQPTRLIQQWFDKRNPHSIFRATVGNTPTLADVIRLAHVSDNGEEPRRALYRYILGMASDATVEPAQKEKNQFYEFEKLPPLVKEFENFKKDPTKAEVPKVPFQMLTGVPLSTAQWTKIALDGNWHFTRMNLNTFARHDVLKDKKVCKKIAEKLASKEDVQRARVFPYQLLMAYHAVDEGVPTSVKNALQTAMEAATENTPAFEGNVYVFPDVSGSMGSPATGQRGTATTKVMCRDVAALFAACVLRKNEDAKVIPVCTKLHLNVKLNPRDTVMTNAKKLAINGGGTNLSMALQHILSLPKNKKEPVDTVFFISDNQSWADAHARTWFGQDTTNMVKLWEKIRVFSPKAKLVCINIQPYGDTPASGDSILNVGGFSDNTWTVVDKFVKDEKDADFVSEIEAIDLDEVPVVN